MGGKLSRVDYINLSIYFKEHINAEHSYFIFLRGFVPRGNDLKHRYAYACFVIVPVSLATKPPLNV